ncbi:response regulator transcription factor [Pseudenhygromyxa sp. WMMC2535]|uniref:response regulator transcription factor n=1 Tax=Pseudenhygromyxa sp. WMMC2535 TaxID=2712867 RepID=UPI00155619CA|nr:response regulator transcription factor [Pseudenhygromyxa sp. WMMC2535]NVB40780.1 response regulator transcription factor [Pseudenhygromyxa sp. WMMC2535]
MAIRALLIDDDPRLFELLSGYLGKNGVELQHALDGGIGLRTLAEGGFDVVLLDGMMPGMDGLEVLRRIRERSAIPVLMLTARGDEADRVVGLELGADDYVAKPFSSRELLARMRAVLRRLHPEIGRERLSANGVEVDVGTREVRVEGEAITLTGLEFDLLVALIRRAGRVVPRSALLHEAGRDDVVVGERTVDVHVSRLRKKLGDADKIKTVRGVGYVFGRGDE